MPGVGIDDRRWGPEAKWDYRGVVKDAFVASAYKPPVLEVRDKVYVHAEMEINKSGNHELKRAAHGSAALEAERLATTYSIADAQRGPESESKSLTREMRDLKLDVPDWRLRSVKEAPAPKVEMSKGGKLENTLDPDTLRRALEASMGSVTWPHVRLMVRGKGGVGKSSTINAMAGKEFDAAHKSTVGTGMGGT